MNNILAVFILQILGFGLAEPSGVSSDDPRPPVIQSKMTDAELKSLRGAEERAQKAEAALALANGGLSNLKFKIEQDHRTNETGDYVNCGMIGYVASIERMYVVFRLGQQECHPM